MSLDQAIAEAAEAGARKALSAHVPKLALSVAEVAKATGAGVTTVRRWITDGHLSRVPHTDRVLIPVAAVEAFVLSGCASTPAVMAGVGGPAGTTGTRDNHPSDRVSPLQRPQAEGTAGPHSTARGGPTSPAA